MIKVQTFGESNSNRYVKYQVLTYFEALAVYSSSFYKHASLSFSLVISDLLFNSLCRVSTLYHVFT